MHQALVRDLARLQIQHRLDDAALVRRAAAFGRRRPPWKPARPPRAPGSVQRALLRPVSGVRRGAA
jgi:hypothetical protein